MSIIIKNVQTNEYYFNLVDNYYHIIYFLD